MANGRHICHGTVREYASLLCSVCGGRNAVELPEDDDIPIPGGDGAVRDKRRFAHYLDAPTSEK